MINTCLHVSTLQDLGVMMPRISKSFKERIEKSREAMMGAVELYNNPNMTFKSEAFITLAIIAWTYLMHAYYQSQKVEFRYYSSKGSVRRYDRTKYGAFKYWELEKCINSKESPLDQATTDNLLFLIGIRHEIEHQLTHRIDEYISAKLQACAQNYERWICELFGAQYSVADNLALAIQMSPLSTTQQKSLIDGTGLSKNVRNFITKFEIDLDEETLQNQGYAYRVIFVPVNVNRPGQADRVIEFVPAESVLAKEVSYALIKHTEKPKYLPKQVVEMMNARGYPSFSITMHTNIWKSENARRANSGYGVFVQKTWYWYDSWIEHVEEWCKNNLHN